MPSGTNLAKSDNRTPEALIFIVSISDFNFYEKLRSSFEGVLEICKP